MSIEIRFETRWRGHGFLFLIYSIFPISQIHEPLRLAWVPPIGLGFPWTASQWALRLPWAPSEWSLGSRLKTSHGCPIHGGGRKQGRLLSVGFPVRIGPCLCAVRTGLLCFIAQMCRFSFANGFTMTADMRGRCPRLALPGLAVRKDECLCSMRCKSEGFN